jgi:hypothetical protein
MDINDTEVFSSVDWIHLDQNSFSSGFQQRYTVLNKPSDY